MTWQQHPHHWIFPLCKPFLRSLLLRRFHSCLKMKTTSKGNFHLRISGFFPLGGGDPPPSRTKSAKRFFKASLSLPVLLKKTHPRATRSNASLWPRLPPLPSSRGNQAVSEVWTATWANIVWKCERLQMCTNLNWLEHPSDQRCQICTCNPNCSRMYVKTRASKTST